MNDPAAQGRIDAEIQSRREMDEILMKTIDALAERVAKLETLATLRNEPDA